MPAPLISFVIPVRNDAVRLRRCLQSIRDDPSLVPNEIIVADNGSTDGSADTARDFGALVVSLPNRRVSDVRNRAAQHVTSATIAFVDADHSLASGWAAAAVASLADPAVSAAGADYCAPHDGTWVQRMYDNFRARATQPRRTDWLPSGNLVVKKDAFERVHGFDTSLESCEDVDLSRRLREDGGTLIADDALRSIHHGDPKSLRALFFAELWRGRDNLRVSLRERLTFKTALGLILTLAVLAAFAAVLIGLAGIAFGGLWVTLGGVLVALTVSAARSVRLLANRPPGRHQMLDIPQAFLVAATYDAARALALLVRVGHDVRRKAGR